MSKAPGSTSANPNTMANSVADSFDLYSNVGLAPSYIQIRALVLEM